MKAINCAMAIIKGNLCEARKYIEDAYRYKDVDKPMADWFRDMAAGHMTFNQRGHQIVKAMVDATQLEESDLVTGMLANYKEIHADLTAEAAEISAMISTYK